MIDPIFQPIKIHNMDIKNRIYMPAMHLNMAKNYFITDQLVDFYAERAKGGAGMIAVGYATVDEKAGSFAYIGAHNDDFIPGLERLSKAIKENGARAVVQLNHAGRYNVSFFMGGKKPVAPSPIPSKLTNETPEELSVEEIEEIIQSFGAAALRVKTAGFDAVEILSGTGYLISEFLSPVTNQRTDEYGGSFENRMRFAVRIIQEVRKCVGSDFPLMVRMNGNEFMPGGLTSKELKMYAQKLNQEGVNAICVNVGWHEARVPQIVTEVPRGVFGYLARGIKEIVNIPVIASHRINDPKTAREMIADGMCDMVAMGRSLIADPYLPEKTKAGRENEIVHCIACAQGCFDNLFKFKNVECLCNPKAGHEKDRKIEKAANPKKVMVIGGGPAGMSAAIAAAEGGHAVTIYEKSSRLGGQLFLAGAPPGRHEFSELAKDLETQVYVKGIRVVLNQAVDEPTIQNEKPDAVILATGAIPIVPLIEGIKLPHVVQGWDVLSGKAYTGHRVVIIGGGAVGVETALYLADKGTMSGDALKFLFVNKAEDPELLFEMATKGTKQITILEMIDTIGKDIGKSTRWAMLQDLGRRGIIVKTTTKAMEITPQGIKVETNGKIEEIQADTVVLGAGSQSYNPLQQKVEQMKIPCKVIGDAKQVAKAFDAIHQGFIAGREI